jgi:MATE family multidrug resistance protein
MKNRLEKHLAGPGGINEMLAIAFPMVISSACDTVMIFTDRLFLARIGPQQMSAAMGGGLTCFMMTTFFLGLTGYCTALTAQYLGAGRKSVCPVVITQGLIISVLAWSIILAARPLALWLFRVTGVPPEQLVPQVEYFNILLWGVLFSLLRNCLGCFFSGIGKTRTVMVSALTAAAVNVGANYIMIFGKCGCPPLGIRGAAYGTILGSICGLVILMVVYLSKKQQREYNIFRSFRYDGLLMKKLWRFGYPAGLELFLNLLAFDLLILNFHACGSETAASVTIVFNWDAVSFIPLVGVHIGVTSLVGRYMGARLPDTANRAAFSGLKLAWLYSFCTMMIFALFPDPLVQVFRPPGADEIFTRAFPDAVFMLRLASLYVMADATMLVFGGALRGAGDTFWAMCISVSMHWILVGGQVLLLRIFNLSARATWLFLCLTLLLFSGIFYLRYHSGKWRSLRLIEEGIEPMPEPVNGLHETKDL